MTRPDSDEHLTDADLLSLAAPASGEPEPLPRHLSTCDACSRALQEWRTAMRDVAREDAAELERRTSEEWRLAEDATMAAIRKAQPRRSAPVSRWAIGIAAALILVALAMPFRRGASPAPPAEPADMALVSPADRAGLDAAVLL